MNRHRLVCWMVLGMLACPTRSSAEECRWLRPRGARDDRADVVKARLLGEAATPHIGLPETPDEVVGRLLRRVGAQGQAHARQWGLRLKSAAMLETFLREEAVQPADLTDLQRAWLTALRQVEPGFPVERILFVPPQSDLALAFDVAPRGGRMIR